MTGEFYDPGFAVKIDPCDFKLPVAKSISVLWIETVVAGELFFSFRVAVGLKGK